MMWDCANYLNEFICDNAPEGLKEIQYYHENESTEFEKLQLIKYYIQRYYEKYIPKEEKDKYIDFNDYHNKNIEKFLQDVKKCIFLNNVYWGVWTFALIKDEEITKEDVFHYDFAEGRIQLIQ